MIWAFNLQASCRLNASFMLLSCVLFLSFVSLRSKLSQAAGTLIEEVTNELVFSAAGLWEISTKHRLS